MQAILGLIKPSNVIVQQINFKSGLRKVESAIDNRVERPLLGPIETEMLH